MSANEPPTYEQLVANVKGMQGQMTDYKKQLSTFSASTKKAMDEKDDKLDASFKVAMDDMDKKDKDHTAMHEENEKVKDAFKKANDEKDPEKKKEAMKKAMDMKDDHDEKTSKKAMDEPHKDKKVNEAKIAETIMNKIPLIEKILIAEKMINPTKVEETRKILLASSMEEVQAKYNLLTPYIAALGLSGNIPTKQSFTGIPFQASTITADATPDNLFEASVDDIDFDKVDTTKILGLYT